MPYLPVSGHDHETVRCEAVPLKFLALHLTGARAPHPVTPRGGTSPLAALGSRYATYG